MEAADHFLAHVEEGLGTKNLVADAVYAQSGQCFYREVAIDTVATIVNDLITFMGVMAAGFARDFFLRNRVRQQETVKLQAHAVQLQAQLAEARLETLRMQLNPHFLFNTLNAVSTLVERDPRGVRRMIARLSELLRYTLNQDSDQEIALAKKIEVTRKRFRRKVLECDGALLQVVDTLWLEHLETMEYLRRSVSLRAYGQRDPLIEYRREGLMRFRELEAEGTVDLPTGSAPSSTACR